MFSSGPTQRYANKVKIGNWNEDLVLERLRVKDFLERKERGELMVTSVQKRLQHSIQPLPLSTSADGNLHFGDSILCYNVQTNGILSVDKSEKMPGYIEAYAVTTSTLIKGPVARNVFVIEAVDNSSHVGDLLMYGQSFRLRMNSILHDQSLFLHSQPVTPLAASKITRHCEIVMSVEKTYDTVFQAVFKDISYRLEMEGSAVAANTELVIRHCNTRQNLSSSAVQHNDFGAEFEVCGETALTSDKIHVLHAEFKGNITSEVSLRPEQPKNHWAFLNASVSDEASMSSDAVSNSVH